MTTKGKSQQENDVPDWTGNDVNEVTQDVWNEFLSQVEDDIKSSKNFASSEYKKTFIDQCVHARTAFYNLQCHLGNESRIFIDEALQCSENETDKRKKVGETWERVFNASIVRAKQIFYPIQNILAILCEKNSKLTRKYQIWLTTGGALLLAGGAVGGIVLCHFLPSTVFGFTLTNALCAAGCGAVAASVIPPVLGALALIGVGVAIYLLYSGVRAKKECSRLRDIRLKIRVWLLKNFPSFMKLAGNVEQKMTEEQLMNNLQKLLMPTQIDENTWLSNTALMAFQRDVKWHFDQLSEEETGGRGEIN